MKVENHGFLTLCDLLRFGKPKSSRALIGQEERLGLFARSNHGHGPPNILMRAHWPSPKNKTPPLCNPRQGWQPSLAFLLAKNLTLYINYSGEKSRVKFRERSGRQCLPERAASQNVRVTRRNNCSLMTRLFKTFIPAKTVQI